MSLIRLTDENTGPMHPAATHLVEMFPQLGDPQPEFFFGPKSGKWIQNASESLPTGAGDLRFRFACRAEPHEIPTASDLPAAIPAEADGRPVTEDEAVLESFGFSKIYSDEAYSDWSIKEGLEVRVRFFAATSVCAATSGWVIGKEAMPFHNKPKTWGDVRRLLVGLNFSSLRAALAAAGKGL